MGCNPECYTKGRGCVVSNTGRCALLFEPTEKPRIKSFKEAYEAMLRDNKSKINTHKYSTKINRKIAP